MIANDATPSYPGSIEYVLHSTGMPRFILDMRRASPDDPDASWLFGRTLYRTIGAVVHAQRCGRRRLNHGRGPYPCAVSPSTHVSVLNVTDEIAARDESLGDPTQLTRP